MTRGSAHTRIGLALVWLMLSAAHAHAAAKAADVRSRPVTPVSLLGWCTALLALAGAAWAASVHAPRQDRTERERVAKLLSRLEQAQQARLAERERHGLRRRRPASGADLRSATAARLEGGFSFLDGARAQERSSPTPPPKRRVPTPPPPPSAAAPEPPAAEPGPRETATTQVSQQLALLLEAIAAAERRLKALRAEELARTRALADAPVEPAALGRTLDLGPLDLPGEPLQDLDVGALDDPTSNDLLTRLRALGPVASHDSIAHTLNLGPLDMPDGTTLDLGALDVPDEVLDRLRALAEIAVADGTVDLGPLELPGPQELLAHLRAVPEGSLSGTINLGPPDLPER